MSPIVIRVDRSGEFPHLLLTVPLDYEGPVPGFVWSESTDSVISDIGAGVIRRSPRVWVWYPPSEDRS